MRKISLLVSGIVGLIFFSSFLTVFAQSVPQFSFKAIDPTFTIEIKPGSTVEKEFLIGNGDTNRSITVRLEKGVSESEGKLPLPADWTSFSLGSEFRIGPLGSAKASLRIAVPVEAPNAQYLLPIHAGIINYDGKKEVKNTGGAGLTISSALGYELTTIVKGVANSSATATVASPSSFWWYLVAITVLVVIIIILGVKFFTKRKKIVM